MQMHNFINVVLTRKKCAKNQKNNLVSGLVGFASQHSLLHALKVTNIFVKLNRMQCKQTDFV